MANCDGDVFCFFFFFFNSSSCHEAAIVAPSVVFSPFPPPLPSSCLLSLVSIHSQSAAHGGKNKSTMVLTPKIRSEDGHRTLNPFILFFLIFFFFLSPARRENWEGRKDSFVCHAEFCTSVSRVFQGLVKFFFIAGMKLYKMYGKLVK